MKQPDKKELVKQKIKEETQLFILYTIFLTLCFCAFTAYRRLILGEYAISYTHYGFSVIEALILAKVILIGQSLGIGKRFENKPLIIPTLYKTFIFCFFVLIFTVFEHFIMGFIHGENIAKIYQGFVNTGVRESLARILIMLFVFVFFFAFLETAGVLGKKRLFNLFFRRNR